MPSWETCTIEEKFEILIKLNKEILNELYFKLVYTFSKLCLKLYSLYLVLKAIFKGQPQDKWGRIKLGFAYVGCLI